MLYILFLSGGISESTLEVKRHEMAACGSTEDVEWTEWV